MPCSRSLRDSRPLQARRDGGGPRPRTWARAAPPRGARAPPRQAAHQSHHALARLYRTKLGDPARAREHLEAALALDPRDSAALDELIPYFRATGRTQELAEARREYQALLASEAGTPRGGRPRKVRPKKSELSLEDSLDEFKGSEGEHEDE